MKTFKVRSRCKHLWEYVGMGCSKCVKCLAVREP